MQRFFFAAELQLMSQFIDISFEWTHISIVADFCWVLSHKWELKWSVWSAVLMQLGGTLRREPC